MQIIEKKLADLIPYERNPRKNEQAVAQVTNSIREFGFKVPIVVDKNNVIVAGHTRYKAAQQLQLDTVPVIIADDLTDNQVKAFRLADNKTGELAGWDFEMLEQELQDVLDLDMSDFGFDTSDMPDLSDFQLDDQNNGSTKTPRTITCPHCGQEFEIT